jgi:thiamine thiazole synthase
VNGVVINWSSVELAKLHIDPLSFKSKIVIDATGHPCEIAHIVERKSGGKLLTPSGKIEGEKSMWAEVAERLTLENTKEVFSNLYVCGMAANAVFGGPRMGPIFGGMLLSGKKIAEIVMKKI